MHRPLPPRRPGRGALLRPVRPVVLRTAPRQSNIVGPAVAITVTAPAGVVTTYALDRSTNVIGLTMITTAVPYEPGSLLVSVGNGTPSGTAYFFVDGSTTSFFSCDLDEVGSAVSVSVPIDGLTAGAHTLQVGNATSSPEPTSSQGFVIDVGDFVEGTTTSATPPPLTTTQWTFRAYDFTDPSHIVTYAFAINPTTVDQNFGELALTTESTTKYDGSIITWEGAPVPASWTFTGRVLTKYDHDAMIYWANINQRIWLTDEFSRQYLVKIEDLKMVRKREPQNPWDHEYTCTITVLSGQGVPT